MKRAFRALGLSASVLGALVAVGCGGPSTTNEDVVGPGTAPPTQGAAPPTQGAAPSYKGYADFAKSQGDQTAKGAGKSKDASQGQAAGKGK